MKPSETQAWRLSPFVVGRQYRVRHDFAALRDSFRAGEILTFHHDAYSRYDNYTGYFFSQPDTQPVRVWDIHDDENLDSWQALFEAIEGDVL
ncbi:MAG: hypothetical protein NT075_20985 [Chloroflexi bacterium]|nr:hypothetical protein [Chloroflexota bacterium]